MAITAKQPGQRESNRRCAFYFRGQNKTVLACCGKREADMTYMLRRPQGDGYSFATGGAGDGFGGKGSGGGTGGGGVGVGGDGFSGIWSPH